MPTSAISLSQLPLRCPRCKADARVSDDRLKCSGCNSVFPVRAGALRCEPNALLFTESFDTQLRNIIKRWPRVYYFIATVFGPHLYSGMSPRVFLKKFRSRDGLTVNLGSGPKILGSSVINVDIYPYPGVLICSDIHTVPFRSDSVQTIVCNDVIEHIERPSDLVKEVHRLLAPGGFAHFTFPFMYPYHASPVDFSRWTKAGFASLLNDFEIVESGVRAGPFSALTAFCCYLFALVFSFNSEKLFWILMNVSIFIFFPLKIFDVIASRVTFATHLASHLYFVARKK